MKNAAILFFLLLFSTLSHATTIVLVHGAFADGSSWEKVIPIIKTAGFKVVAVQLPMTSLKDDVDTTNRAIENAADNVVLVGHSYAGVVISQAGMNANVKQLVYVAAFAPDAGQSAADVSAAYPPTPGLGQIVVDKFGYAKLTDDGVKNDFAQDLPDDQTSVMAAVQGPIFATNLTDKVTDAAWKTKPSYYIVAQNDRMIDPNLQKDSANKMSAKTTSLDSSHAVMLAKPAEVAAVILAAATVGSKK
ncbi:MAG TPA: alpha/beta hydrolase [Bdellovibrio sp.]|nr:alpha/beta hydrolase [Bdellovibrio sp.]